ncbi:MAG: 5'-nucleotidase [Bacteroidota bacterium]
MIRPLVLTLCVIAICAGCKPYYQAETVVANRQSLTEASVADESVSQEVEEMIDPYRQELETAMAEVIGQVDEPLTLSAGVSTLGNWVAVLLYDDAKRLFPDQPIDFAITNRGGLRIVEIPAGPITMEDMYRLMPFDNELVLVNINGVVMEEFLDYMVERWRGWPQSSQLRYRIEGNKPMAVTIQDTSPVLNRNYLVAMPDYIANGGDNAEMLADRPQIKSGQLIRDLLIDAIKRRRVIQAELDGRIE